MVYLFFKGIILNPDNILPLLQEAEIFSCFSEQELQGLVAAIQASTHDFGDSVLTAGDAVEGLYLVASGKVRIIHHDGEKERNLGVVGSGGVFGEKFVFKEGASDFSARSSAQSEVLLIPRTALATMMGNNRSGESFVKQYVALKLTGGLVSELFDLRQKASREDIEEIVRSVGVKNFKAGKVILEQESSQDRRLYVVRSGRVQLSRDEENKKYDLLTLEAGEVLGEKAVLYYTPQYAEAKAVTDVTVIVIPQKTINFIVEHNPSIREIFDERIARLDKELDRQKKVDRLKPSVNMFSKGEKAGLGTKLIKRFERVQQAEEMDCGAACLAMICKHYKIPMTLGKLREMANVTTEGASMESLAQTGEALGFTTKGVRSTFPTLSSFELPFIAHWQGYHWVVVYGISKKHIWLADPGEGFKKMSATEFEHGWTGNCLTFVKSADVQFEGGVVSPWKRFISYVLPQKKIIRDLFVAALLLQLFGLVAPVLIQNILDRVVVHQNYSLLNLMIAGVFIVTIFSQVTDYLSAYLSNFMTRKMDFSMMSEFCRHVFSLPVDFFARRKTGDINARFQENETIRQFMTESSIGTVLNAIMVFVYIIVLFKYSVSLTFVLLACVVPLIVLTLLVTPKYKEYARKSFYAEAEAESLLLESLSGAESIKAMSVERGMRKKWEQKYAKSLDINFKSEMFTSLVDGISSFIKSATSIIILYLGARMVLEQQLSIGQLMAFTSLVGSVMTPLLGLVGVWDEFQEAMVSMERLGDVLELEPEQRPEDISSRIILPELAGDIVCKDLFFRYGGEKSPYILEGINLSIKAGQTIAIVGGSGSGKTTLAKLLVGLYLPTEGSISIDGYDIGSVDLEYYRKHIGYVMQNNLLFAGTVGENIAMGDTNFDHRRLTEVAKLADAHGFISNLPLGYEQVVGERGAGLSGGQIQRICIARALYSDPKLLVFDEATSALDGESESLIQKNLEQILTNRTAVVIAHRLSTIQQADVILVLYEGAIAESGTHQELIDRKGMYYHLVKKQMG